MAHSLELVSTRGFYGTAEYRITAISTRGFYDGYTSLAPTLDTRKVFKTHEAEDIEWEEIVDDVPRNVGYGDNKLTRQRSWKKDDSEG